MFQYNSINNQVEINDEQQLNKWLNVKMVSENTRFDINDEDVKKIIDKYKNEHNKQYIYTGLKGFYLTRCKDINDFLTKINNKIDQYDNFEDLTNELIK